MGLGVVNVMFNCDICMKFNLVPDKQELIPFCILRLPLFYVSNRFAMNL